MGKRFAMVTEDHLRDKRMTPTDKLVLFSIMTFADSKTGKAFPSLEAISESCGIHPVNVSKSTKHLVELCWITKEGKGGFGKPCVYTVLNPFSGNTVSELDTVPETTLADSTKVDVETTLADSTKVDSTTLAASAKSTLADSAKGKEHTNEQTIKTKHTNSKFTASGFLVEHGGDMELVDDWLTVRKSKKASPTSTAMKLFLAEVEKSGKDINEVLTLCIEKSWAGFKAVWLNNLESSANGSYVPNRDKRTATEKFFDAIGPADLSNYEPRVASVVKYWDDTLKTGGSANKDACDLIVKRLTEQDGDFNFGEFVLRDAIDACLKSEYHMKKNFTRLNDILSDKNFDTFVEAGKGLTFRSTMDWQRARDLRPTGGVVIEGQTKRVDSKLIEHVPF